MKSVVSLACAWLLLAAPSAFAIDVPPAEITAIAKDAYMYGFPIVESYRIQFGYFVNKRDKQYKGEWNRLQEAGPDSVLGADLRTEPLVITVPQVEKARSSSIQFVDLYTFEFDAVGSPASGSEPGNYLLAGPQWKGEKPAGVKRVIRSETEFAMAIVRTQLLNAADVDNVKKIQAGYKVQPLSAFLGKPAPAAARAIEFPQPLAPGQARKAPRFFDVLNFVLQFCPVHPSEKAMRARFAKIGIAAGNRFEPRTLSREERDAIKAGIADAWKELAAYKANETHAGTRAAMTKADGQRMYLARMAAAQGLEARWK
ncbi:MAG TPA: DUF1254 domain-containing protein [Usitatibacter sp.]|nr:DUF1254 domain-containing protein [Usitatibacter sp.]